jgi:ribonuclease BN (tRNA processing enzyme)
MLLVTVGTGTVVPDPERASACHWIEHSDTRIVIDCGAGSLQGLARSGLPWGEVEHLLISHFHTDHIAEIPALIFALRHALEVPRTASLQVWGPKGVRALLGSFADAFGAWILDPGFPIEIHELSAGTPVEIGGLVAQTIATPHTEESLALRLEGEAIFGYTGDTGPAEELGPFFRGADLLLAECSLPDELALENHLTPSSLARLAQACAVPRLVVTHVYPQLQRLDVPDLIRRAGFTGEIIMARDGLRLHVKPQR